MSRLTRLARLALALASLTLAAPARAAIDARGPGPGGACPDRSPAVVPQLSLDASGDLILTLHCAVADDLNWRLILSTSLIRPRSR